MWEQCKHIVVDCLAHGLTWQQWHYIWDSILCAASSQDLTHHYYDIFGLVGEAELQVLIVLLNASKIDLIPLSLHTLLGHHRVPVEFLASLASRDHDRLSIHNLLINHDMLNLDSYLLVCLKANIHFVCCHSIQFADLFGHRRTGLYLKYLGNRCFLYWVGQRDILG